MQARLSSLLGKQLLEQSETRSKLKHNKSIEKKRVKEALKPQHNKSTEKRVKQALQPEPNQVFRIKPSALTDFNYMRQLVNTRSSWSFPMIAAKITPQQLESYAECMSDHICLENAKTGQEIALIRAFEAPRSVYDRTLYTKLEENSDVKVKTLWEIGEDEFAIPRAFGGKGTDEIWVRVGGSGAYPKNKLNELE